MPVTVNLSGEGIEFEREVSENTALKLMELSINNGADSDEVMDAILADNEDRDTDEEEAGALPSNFFNRLSKKQRAMIKVLLNADGQITSSELRQRMEDEHDVGTGGGRALAGILAGFTRKYGDDFDLVTVNWGDGQGLYQLNPNRPEYIAELEEYFGE